MISNCVLNLSTDKSRVLREAFRVLKPGRRVAVSDVVLCGEVPSLGRDNPQLWAGCLAGAMQEEEYKTDQHRGRFLCREISVANSGIAERLAQMHLGGAFLLGVLFALSFCPISAALFFGSLIPLATASRSSIIFPALYGLGTSLPVFAFALLTALAQNPCPGRLTG